MKLLLFGFIQSQQTLVTLFFCHIIKVQDMPWTLEFRSLLKCDPTVIWCSCHILLIQTHNVTYISCNVMDTTCIFYIFLVPFKGICCWMFPSWKNQFVVRRRRWHCGYLPYFHAACPFPWWWQFASRTAFCAHPHWQSWKAMKNDFHMTMTQSLVYWCEHGQILNDHISNKLQHYWDIERTFHNYASNQSDNKVSSHP